MTAPVSLQASCGTGTAWVTQNDPNTRRFTHRNEELNSKTPKFEEKVGISH
jgi:hypothetical protein